MGNLAMAVRIQRDADIEAILHVCGRDRNLLATLAHLLGAHDLGAEKPGHHHRATRRRWATFQTPRPSTISIRLAFSSWPRA